jgi:hypothetical protein
MDQGNHYQHTGKIEQGMKYRQFHSVIIRSYSHAVADDIDCPDKLADENDCDNTGDDIEDQVRARQPFAFNIGAQCSDVASARPLS